MQLTEDQNDSQYQIQAYEPGTITINQQHYKKSLILTPQVLISDWAPQSLSELTDQHLEQILALKPDLILLGTGETFKMPPTRLLAPLYQAGYGAECMDTCAACRSFIALSSEGRKVAAALLIK